MMISLSNPNLFDSSLKKTFTECFPDPLTTIALNLGGAGRGHMFLIQCSQECLRIVFPYTFIRFEAQDLFLLLRILFGNTILNV